MLLHLKQIKIYSRYPETAFCIDQEITLKQPIVDIYTKDQSLFESTAIHKESLKLPNLMELLSIELLTLFVSNFIIAI